MASLGNDNIRRAIQNTTGIVNAIRQAQAGQPTVFSKPIPQQSGDNAQFNPASRIPDIIDKVGELDLSGRYDNGISWVHAPWTRPPLPDRPVYMHENERRKGKAWKQFLNHNLYNIGNAPRHIKETGTLPRSYLSTAAQMDIWPEYSEIPLDARLTPEQWLRGAKSDVYRYLGGGA